MMKRATILTFIWLALLPSAAFAQGANPAIAPFEPSLMRLAEILGALHYLDRLCGDPADNQWRDKMEALLSAEKPTDARRAKLTANFNRLYRSYADSYAKCTESAQVSLAHFRAEGERTARETAALYGN